MWAATEGTAEQRTAGSLTRYHDDDIIIHMRTRTIISLEQWQLRALKVRAQAQGVSVAELVRGLVTECLKDERPPSSVPLSRYERIVALGSSGLPDVADRHDAFLADTLRKDHAG